MVRVGTKARKKRSETWRTSGANGPRLVPPARRSVTQRASGARNRSAAVPALKVVSSNVRWGKVKTAQARMAVDYYDRKDVKEALLDAVLEELSRN